MRARAEARSRRTGRPAAGGGAHRAAGRPAGSTGDRTRERILTKSIQAFAELGFAGAALRDIARKARIRVSSLYHYYPSKDALYQAVEERVQDEVRELMLSVLGRGLDLSEMTRETVGRLFDFYLARPAYVRLGYRMHIETGRARQSSRRVVDRWLGLMDGLMKPAEREGRLKPIDPTLFLVTVDGLVHWHLASNAYYQAFLGRGLDDPDTAGRVRTHLIEMVLRTVGLD